MDILDLRTAIPDLDCETAIAQMGGDTELYTRALRSTAKSAPDTLSNLDALLFSADMHQFYVAIHGLKGVLAIVGATALSAEAQLLCNAAKASDISAVEQYYPSFRTKLTELTEAITNLDSK